MKKLLLTLGTVAAVAAPVASVIACGSSDSTTASATASYDKATKLLKLNIDLGSDKSIETLALGKTIKLMRTAVDKIEATTDFDAATTNVDKINATFKYNGKKAEIDGAITPNPNPAATLLTLLNDNFVNFAERLGAKEGFEFVTDEKYHADQLAEVKKLLAEGKGIQNLEELNEVLDNIFPMKGQKVEKDGDHFKIHFGFSEESEADAAAHTSIKQVVDYMKDTLHTFTLAVDKNLSQPEQDEIKTINDDLARLIDIKPKATGAGTAEAALISTKTATELETEGNNDHDSDKVSDLNSAFGITLSVDATENVTDVNYDSVKHTLTFLHATGMATLGDSVTVTITPKA